MASTHLRYKISFLVFFILITASSIVRGQCPGTGCTYTITGADAGTYIVNVGEKICLEAGANFTGTASLRGGTLQNCATANQSFSIATISTSPNGVFDNYGTITPSSASTTLRHGLTLNNYGTMNFGDLQVLTGTSIDNAGVINITGDLSLSGTLVNSGSMVISGKLDGNSGSIINNSGTLDVNDLEIRNEWTNSGQIESTNAAIFITNSNGIIEGGCLTANTFTNAGTITGTTCGNIFVQDASANYSSGEITGDIAFVDLTPPGSAPFIDNNSGTIGPNVTFTSCTDCTPIEICNNSTDDNGDGRIDEPYPGGVQSNLQLWLKADVGTNTTANGSNVTSWSDESTNSYSANADINATDWPTFTETAINYNPGIDFDGDYTDDFSDGLHLGSDYIFGEKEGLHVFIVCDPNIDAETDNYVFDFGLAANGGYGMIYSNDDYGMYTNNSAGGASTELLHSEGDEPALIEFEVDFADFQAFFRNGTELTNTPVTITQLTDSEVDEDSTYLTGGSSVRGPVSIGRKSASAFLSTMGGQIFNGKISEVIVINDSISTQDKEKINAYLAVKYGITLNHDYISSTGTVIKDISDGYANIIAGIGRDDCASLYQKQSKSVEPEAVVAVGVGTIATSNQANTGALSSDETYLMWGNDGVAENTSWNNANVNVAGYDYSRVDRVWRFSEQLDVTNVTLELALDNPLYSFPAIPGTADGFYYLLIDDDGDFTNGGTTGYQMNTISPSMAEVIIADPTNSYFSFGVRPPALCNAQAPTLSK